jgi:GTP-binding protein EngB required for normal cell division
MTLFKFELIVTDAPYPKLIRAWPQGIEINRIIVCVRSNYGKATIFNGIFESSKAGRIEQFFAKIGLFDASRFGVNLLC